MAHNHGNEYHMLIRLLPKSEPRRSRRPTPRSTTLGAARSRCGEKLLLGTNRISMEYQIRIVREDGIEELSGWMKSTEQVVQAMLAVHRPQGTTYWLLVRNILCPNCSDREQIVECPIMHVPSPRYIPLDSGYLQVVESRNRCALYFSASGHAP